MGRTFAVGDSSAFRCQTPFTRYKPVQPLRQPIGRAVEDLFEYSYFYAWVITSQYVAACQHGVGATITDNK